jgi:hypothetical protein
MGKRKGDIYGFGLYEGDYYEITRSTQIAFANWLEPEIFGDYTGQEQLSDGKQIHYQTFGENVLINPRTKRSYFQEDAVPDGSRVIDDNMQSLVKNGTLSDNISADRVSTDLLCSADDIETKLAPDQLKALSDELRKEVEENDPYEGAFDGGFELAGYAGEMQKMLDEAFLGFASYFSVSLDDPFKLDNQFGGKKKDF